nr:integrase, catalytic region, zinc finger, CCHC-type, peptidase aspartic, catalytic [Tanacetum cinerariifolium]
MFNEYLNPPASVDLQVPTVIAIKPNVSTGTPSSTTIDQDATPTSTSRTPPETPSQVIPLGFEEADHDIEVAHMDNNPFVEFPIPEPSSKESSTQSYKDALIESCWIEAMQEEFNKFKRLKVWEIVPRPDCVMVITLKWIYKVKLDELGGLQISQSPRGIFLNKSKYALESIKKYGMESCEPVDTAMVEKSKLDEDP